MKNSKLTVLVLTLILFSFNKAKSQDTCFVIFEGAKKPFYSFLNDTLKTNKPQLSDTLFISSESLIKLVEDSTFTQGKLDFKPKKNTLFRYQILSKANTLFLLKLGEEKLLSFKPYTKVFKEDTLLKSKNDSILVKATEKLSGGLIGCNNPFNKIKFGSLAKSIDLQLFTSDKLKLLLKEIKNENTCLFAEQFHQLFSLLEFDDQKLELSKQAENNIFDPLNIDNYNFEFLLDSNKEKFEEITSQWKKL